MAPRRRSNKKQPQQAAPSQEDASAATVTVAAPAAAAATPDSEQTSRRQQKKAQRRRDKQASKQAAQQQQQQQQTRATDAHEVKPSREAVAATKETVDYFPPFPADEPTLGFAPPHARLSDDVREFLESVIARAGQDASREHLVRHMRRGLAQVDAFLQQQHTDEHGAAIADFETLVARESELWKSHVQQARDDSDMGVQDRKLQASLQVSMKGMDLKAGRPGRPDDAVYANSEYARKYMPRGNFIAEWRPRAAVRDDGADAEAKALFFPIVRAYRKFTGQEDDGEEKGAVGEELLSKFFTKPKQQARDVISTTKENGEAGHLAVLKRSDGQFLFAMGSKNTHLLALSLEDVENARAAGCTHGNDPYAAAGPIAQALLKMLARLTPAHRAWLCEFLWQTRMTASFEVLCPSHQHVQLLDYIAEDTPVFYGLSLPSYTNTVDGAEICVNPVLPYECMRAIGVRTVAYEVVPFTAELYERALLKIKTSYQHEGAVNLFLDDAASVIGMEKFKTVWYVSLRAIREKAKSFCHKLCPRRAPKGPGPTRAKVLEDSKAQLRKRFVAIKSYLQISEDVACAYRDLGYRFVEFLCEEELPEGTSAAQAQRVKHRVADLFPLVWKDFLDRTQLSDVVQEL